MRRKLNPLLEEKLGVFSRRITTIEKKIKEYDKICIFRHVRPDYDAIGTQLGLYYFLKDNFPNKDIKVVGEDHVTLSGTCFPYMDKVEDEWFEDGNFLAIVVDTATKKRISDQRYKLANYIIKLDHHPNRDPYGNTMIVDENMCAAAELVSGIVLSFKGDYMLGKESAINFYKGIAGDTNCFMYDTVTPYTFFICQILLQKGIILSQLYYEMYRKEERDLNATKYIINHLHFSKKNIGYYVLSKEEMEELNLPVELGKDNLGIFEHMEGVEIWISATYDSDAQFRVSVRSRTIPIDKVCENYRGGGHANASGARVKTLDELNSLISDLEELL